MRRFSVSKGRAPRSLGAGGFTLVELLISISIVGVITGMMMANFRGGQHNTEVRLASDILVDQIRSVQTSSLSGRLVAVCSGGSNNLSVCEPKSPAVTCTGGVCQKRVPTGYGIRFTGTPDKSYILFYDTDGDWRYDGGEELTTTAYVATNNVRMSASSLGTPLDIVYAPPYGQVYVNGVTGAVPTVTLTLTHQFGSATRHVNIHTLSGKIDHD
jgi:prepilin-type N-terminal cleavage/methylation domain-containing protein